MDLKKIVLPVRSSIYASVIAKKVKIDFSVVGFPKCATTSIHKTLERVPSLYMPDHEVQVANIMSGLQQWPQPHFSLTGIKNPNLLYEPHNLLALYKSNKNMKFIISMRNPSDWLFSFYQYRMLEIRDNKDWLQTRLEKNLEYKNISFDDIVYNEQSFLGVSIKHGFFIDYLEDIFNWIPRENILIVMLEEIALDASTAYSRIFDFLGICDINDEETEVGVVANNKNNLYARRDDFTEQLSYLDHIYMQKNEQLNQFLKDRANYNNIFW